MKLHQIIDEMYLDWFNNFLTIQRFAEYYEIGELLAEAIIKEGERRNNETHNS